MVLFVICSGVICLCCWHYLKRCHIFSQVKGLADHLQGMFFFSPNFFFEWDFDFDCTNYILRLV